jgi:uncharacterized integral membrane protein
MAATKGTTTEVVPAAAFGGYHPRCRPDGRAIEVHMKRWLLLGAGALVALVSLVFALINAAAVELDLYFATLGMPLGVLVLAALLLGAMLAGAVLYAGVILPLRLRVGALERRGSAATGDLRD